MKRTLPLIATILCLVMVLASCGATSPAKINKFLNTEYSLDEPFINTSNQISELDGYTLLKSNDYFAVFEKTLSGNPESAAPGLMPEGLTTSYKIFSIIKASVISTFTSSSATDIYTFDLFDRIPLIKVSHMDLLDSSLDGATKTVYDASGASLFSSKASPRDPYNFADLIIFNNVAYSINESTGALSKVCDVPEYHRLNSCDQFNDDYFYIIDGNFDTGGELIVYDRSFNLVSTWTAPSYATGCAIHPLNDGNVFIQYLYELDTDEKKYDFYDVEDGQTVKYDLVSLIFNTKKGSTSEKDLDFVVNMLHSNQALNRSYDESNLRYSDKFDNIAYINPIIDKKIDFSEDATDIVLMSNKLKIKGSLKIVDDQSPAPPRKVGENIYSVGLKKGYALIDEKGDVLNTINIAPYGSSHYIIGEDAIYNLDLTKAYDFIENNAAILAQIGDGILIKAFTSTGYDIILLNKGSQKTVFTHNNADLTIKLKLEVDNSNNFYYIYNAEINEYTYYNANGDVIVTTSCLLDVVATGDDNTLLLVGITEALTPTYFVFIPNK